MQPYQTWVKGILDTIIVFLEKNDWKMIGEKIGTFLAEIDFLDIGMKVGKAIWEAINAGFEILGGMFNKAPFETIILAKVIYHQNRLRTRRSESMEG